MEWSEVLSSLRNVNILLFILVIFLVPLHLITRGLRWRYLLIQEKRDVRFYNLFAGNAVGFTITLIFPGRIGEVVKPIYLARKEEMRTGFVIGTVVVERIFDVFTNCSLLGLFLLAIPVYGSRFQAEEATYSNLKLWGLFGVAFASLLLLLILSLYFFREKAMRVISFFLKPLPEKLSLRMAELFQEFVQGLKFFHSFRNLLMYILLSFVVWLGIIFYYWIAFFAYRINLPFLFVFPYVFLTAVGASIPTPGMVGGFDYFSKLGMTSLFHLDPNRAVGVTIAVHAIQLVVTCLIGYAILWKEGMTLFQLKKLGEGGKR